MLRCLGRRAGPADGAGFSSSPAMICAIESCAVREMFAMRAASAARALSLARSSLKTRPDGSAASSAGTSPVCSGVSVAAVSAAAASGGASAAGVSSAAGASAVGSGSVTAGSALSAGSGSSGALGTSGTVGAAASSRAGVSGGSDLLSDLGSSSSGAAGTGLSCAGGLRSGVSSAGAFFVVLAAFGVLDFAVFVVFVFFLARGFLGDAAGFFVVCPSAAGGSALSVGAGGVSAADWGLAALRRRGFGLGASSGCTAVDFLSSSILTLTLLGTFMDARQNGSGTAGRVCRVQLFYSASRNCRPLFPSSAVCGSADLLPMRSS